MKKVVSDKNQIMQEFNQKMQEQLKVLAATGKLFRSEITGNTLWEIYLDSFEKDSITEYSNVEFLNLYITSSEEIKEGDWFILDMSHSSHSNELHQLGDDKWSKTGGIHFCEGNSWVDSCKKIILTTDQDLIKDGVQPIDDEFLEWFVKNPSCEYVEVKDVYKTFLEGNKRSVSDFREKYKIIIPKEEPKQETLEEAAEWYVRNEPDTTLKLISKYSFKDGVKWHQERSYSEEAMYKLMDEYQDYLFKTNNHVKTFKEWFEQFKKK